MKNAWCQTQALDHLVQVSVPLTSQRPMELKKSYEKYLLNFFLCQKYIFPGLHNYSVRFLSISIPLFRGSFKDLFYSKRQTSGDLKLLTSSLRRSVIDYFASQWESIYIINYTKGCMTVCGFVWEFQHKDYSYEMHVMHIICHVYKGKNTWHLGPHILHLQETNKFIIFFFF